jgi:hypothetical protein
MSNRGKKFLMRASVGIAHIHTLACAASSADYLSKNGFSEKRYALSLIQVKNRLEKRPSNGKF